MRRSILIGKDHAGKWTIVRGTVGRVETNRVLADDRYANGESFGFELESFGFELVIRLPRGSAFNHAATAHQWDLLTAISFDREALAARF